MNTSNLMDLGSEIVRTGCPVGATVAEAKVPNRHKPSVTDKIRTVSCAGTKMAIYVGSLASDPSGLNIYLEIRSRHASLPEYMNVGESSRELVAALGKPLEQNDRAVVYRTSESGSTLKFSLDRGSIAAVRWDWYID